MEIKFTDNFKDIIGLENLLEAWKEFRKGKRDKSDVQEFSIHLMDNIILLHKEFENFTYEHGGYEAFNICDPKPRNIHKTTIRDRLLHHAIYRKLYPFFDKKFISDSYSCRIEKGTHRAINKFRKFACKATKNNTRTCWVLKCDIKKFFASINHQILIDILDSYIDDKNILWLLRKVIKSFSSIKPEIGLPLGNLTSQLFVNIYMNEFDRFVKHSLKIKYYIRYADDFVIFSESKEELENLIVLVKDFLWKGLKLELHPEKIYIKTLNSGIDFLGWVHFFDFRILRTATKKRMIKRIREHPASETLDSYLGLLKHGNTNKLKSKIIKEYILNNGKITNPNHIHLLSIFDDIRF